MFSASRGKAAKSNSTIYSPNLSIDQTVFVLTECKFDDGCTPKRISEVNFTESFPDSATSPVPSGISGLRAALPPDLNLTVERLSPSSVKIGWRNRAGDDQGSGSYTIKVVSQQARYVIYCHFKSLVCLFLAFHT